jgi:4-amino-4-deoxy-L-arabinose transferase-like glycosyltransferase
MLDNGARQSTLRDYVLILILWAATWVVNILWMARDTRPPVWDMAMHQSYALNYLPGRSQGLPTWQRSGTYPPLVHMAIASCYMLLHPGPHVAALVNCPATLLLLWAVYELGVALAGRAAARWAAFLTAAVPLLLWLSRETVLDYWLAAWFALALLVLHRSRGFRSKQLSLLFGVVLAAGMLTKWLFAGLIAAPVACVCVRQGVWKERGRAVNALDALIVAGIVAAPWYLPNLPALVQYFRENMAIGAREGEPAVLSFQSLIYYLRLLEGWQLFALLFAVCVAGSVLSLRKRLLSDRGFWVAAVTGGWLVLTLLRTKDPRFTLPLLGPMMIGAGAWLASWRRGMANTAVKGVLACLLCAQAYAINFGIAWLPRSIVLARGYQGSLRWDWNLYLQDYFDILGPPRRQDWQQQAILRRLADHARDHGIHPSLAIVPDLPRFSAANFLLEARLLGMDVSVDHPQGSGDLRTFDRFNYVVMVPGDQGMPWSTRASLDMNRTIVDEHEVFRIIELYRLPNGDYARLYFVALEDKPRG